MTETITGISSMPEEAKKRTSSSTASARERAAIAEWVKAGRDRGDDITGPDGLVKSITATVLEVALEEEMTDHLGATPSTGSPRVVRATSGTARGARRC
jgi:putative transposase